MGMLFGGWAREEEELVQNEFGGNWNLYRRFKELRDKLPKDSPEEVIYSDSDPKVTKWDLICDENLLNQFSVKEIKEGLIYGVFIDGRNDGATIQYPNQKYNKIESTHGR